MEMGRPLPFEDLVERFLGIAEVSPLYFLSQARSVIDLARPWMSHGSRHPIAEDRDGPGLAYNHSNAKGMQRLETAIRKLEKQLQGKDEELGKVKEQLRELKKPGKSSK
eukprot:s210_g12.t1